MDVKRTFHGICAFLHNNPVEGIVFWLDGEPQCKIKRTDYGYEWPCSGATEVFSLFSLVKPEEMHET